MWEETLLVQYHKVIVLKCQICLPSWKPSTWQQGTNACDTLFHFLLIFVGFFFTKSKPRREQLVITKKPLELHSILWNFWVVRFSNPFIWSQLFCVFVLSIVVSADLSVLKEWRNVLLHVSRIYLFLKPLLPVVLPGVTS